MAEQATVDIHEVLLQHADMADKVKSGYQSLVLMLTKEIQGRDKQIEDLKKQLDDKTVPFNKET